MLHHSKSAAADGLAALSLVESLLLSLGDLKVLSAKDIDNVLEGVAETHRNAAEHTTGEEAAFHLKVAGHAERIMLGGNSSSR